MTKTRLGKRPCNIALLIALVLGCWGCSERRELSPAERHLDNLWRSGYGFNNPNVERVKNGKEPEGWFDRDD